MNMYIKDCLLKKLRNPTKILPVKSPILKMKFSKVIPQTAFIVKGFAKTMFGKSMNVCTKLAYIRMS